jgi:hypothetical protein
VSYPFDGQEKVEWEAEEKNNQNSEDLLALEKVRSCWEWATRIRLL